MTILILFKRKYDPKQIYGMLEWAQRIVDYLQG